MMSSSCRSFSLASVLVLLTISGHAQEQNVESEIRKIMDKYEAIGLSVVVVRDGSIHYSKAFGLKDVESETPLEEKDLFRIASISKSFSATAIMQLVEDGKVSLDNDFSDLVGFKVRNPKYPGKVITLRMVLSHTSSINDSQGYFDFDVINPSKNRDWAKCYNDYAPGAGYEYCNLNFNMVGAVIERLSGERFDTYIRKRILTPLGLYGGYCVDSLDNSLFATLYAYDSSRFEPSPMAYASRKEEMANYVMGYTTPIFSPTGGMKISAPDLAKYMIMHMNFGKYGDAQIISRKSARQMQKVVWKEEGYGLALRRDEKLIPGEVMRGHTGNAYGLHSAMFFHPGKKFGFVVITNGSKPSYVDDMNTVLRDAIKVLYQNFIAE